MSFLRTHFGLWLLATLAVPGGARADEPPMVRADFGYVSQRVFRGVGRTGQSAQAGVELANGIFSGGVWTNLPFAAGEARETNLRAAGTWEPTSAITLEASVAHAWFSHVPGDDVKRTLEAGLAATFAPVNGFTPGLAYQHDFRLRADSLQASLARSIALTKLGAFLELNAFAGAARGNNWRPDAPGSRRQDSYGYWGGEARLPYRIGPHSTVTVGLHYADTSGRSVANGPFGLQTQRSFWFTLGVSLDF